jgi:hypothetical protein
LKKRSRDRELSRAGLTHAAATGSLDKYVVSVNGFRILEGLQDHVLQRHSRKIVFESTSVDIDLSAALHHANVRH